jgi:hypothetical protein
MNWFRLFFGTLMLGATIRVSAQTTNTLPIFTNTPSIGRHHVTVDTVNVARVSASYPVGFALLTHPPYQFVAFYDQDHQLTVAQRRLNRYWYQRRWTFNKLPDITGWDSHNYIALAADDDGYLHLCADMHVSPLKYFRTTKPWDASTFIRVDKMTGLSETNCTYPHFLRGATNELLFTYRSGHSGGGNQIYDVYNLKTQTWQPFLDTPLTDGGGTNNAYFDGPVRGTNGWYNLAWVWRATAYAETCHDLSYARSRDMQHWETSDGKPLTLPIRLNNCEIVDPVPERDGMSNANIKIGFDNQGRVTISYHKNDTNGFTQPYIARLEDGHWVLHQVTYWPTNWNFHGIGTLVSAIRLGRVTVQPDGMLTEHFKHFKYGSGTWVLDPQTLHAIGLLAEDPIAESDKVEGKFPGLEARWENDSGKSGVTNLEYELHWETLDANRDHQPKGRQPKPTMLKVVAVKVTPAKPGS